LSLVILNNFEEYLLLVLYHQKLQLSSPKRLLRLCTPLLSPKLI